MRDPSGGIDVIARGDCRASRQEVGEEDLDQGARRGPVGRVADGQPLIAAWIESDGLEGQTGLLSQLPSSAFGDTLPWLSAPARAVPRLSLIHI